MMFCVSAHIVPFNRKLVNYLLIVFLLHNCSLFGQATSGEVLFDESYVHELRITFSDPDFWETLTDNYNNSASEIDPNTGELTAVEKVYLEANIFIDGNDVGTVGVRQKGFFSNWGAGESLKKPLKIDFNEFVTGNEYDGLKKLNLHNGFQDSSMMRDAIAYKLFRDNGIPTARTSYTRLYLNDVYWGLYLMVEQIDKIFLAQNFSNNDGNLFKCIDDTELDWEGSEMNAYANDFDLKTNETENNWTAFIGFVNTINNSEEIDFESDLETVFMVDEYLKTLALDVMMNNWDSYYGQGRNFYLYYKTEEGKFQWIPWDYNLSFMNYQTELMLTNVADFFEEGYTEKPLTKNILANENLTQKYLQSICDLKNQYFTLDYLENYIDNTAQLIENALNEDPNKFYTMYEFENGTVERPELKSFISNRALEIDNEFDMLNFDCFGLENEEWFANNSLQLYPNPIKEQLNIVLSEELGEAQLTICNSLGILLYVNSNVQQSIQINTENYNSGMYYLQYRVGRNVWNKKFIVQ